MNILAVKEEKQEKGEKAKELKLKRENTHEVIMILSVLAMPRTTPSLLPPFVVGTFFFFPQNQS